jgi:hypothetical protein
MRIHRLLEFAHAIRVDGFVEGFARLYLPANPCKVEPGRQDHAVPSAADSPPKPASARSRINRLHRHVVHPCLAVSGEREAVFDIDSIRRDLGLNDVSLPSAAREALQLARPERR